MKMAQESCKIREEMEKERAIEGVNLINIQYMHV
jgi:hypothetical protein